MPTLLTALCAALAFLLLWQWWRRRTLLHQLTDTLSSKQRYLPVELKTSGIDRSWRRLIEQLNGLIAENQALEDERSSQIGRLETTLRSIQEAVLILEEGSRVVLTNPAFERMFPGQNLSSSHPGGVFLNEDFVEYLNQVRSGDALPGQKEIAFQLGRGKEVWVEVTASSIPHFQGQARPLHLFVLHDITRLKRLEAIRKEFVANVSHELRTPLSMIKGYAETLEEDFEALEKTQCSRFLATIHRHADRLTLLLEDLLALSRLESGDPQMRWSTVDFAELARGVVRTYHESGRSAGRPIELEIADGKDWKIRVDAMKMEQVLENLIDNALKYSEPESSIKVGLEAPDGWLHCWVRDQGGGITPKDLPHIFERFYRTDKGRSREKGGTGIGLSIVKHIIQLHGGKVEAESVPEAGTTIHFHLPRKADSTHPCSSVSISG